MSFLQCLIICLWGYCLPVPLTHKLYGFNKNFLATTNGLRSIGARTPINNCLGVMHLYLYSTMSWYILFYVNIFKIKRKNYTFKHHSQDCTATWHSIKVKIKDG